LYHFPAGHTFRHADPIVESVPAGHAAEQIDAPAAEKKPLGHVSQTPLLLYEPASHVDEHTPMDPKVVDEPVVKFFKISPALHVSGGEFENSVFVVDVHIAVTNCVPVGSLHGVHVPGDPSDVDEPVLNPLRN
jgi:hypothetical protein